MNELGLGTPASEIENRIAGLQKYLQDKDIDGALVQQNTDLFYFTGTGQKGYLYIPADQAPLLMVSKNISRAREESSVNRIISIENSGEIPDRLRQNGYRLPRRLGLENDVIPANVFFRFDRLFDQVPLVDISSQIRTLRAIKSPYEIERIREAAKLSDQVAAYMQEVLCTGLTEIELAGIIEARARKLGHQGVVRMRLWGNEMFYGHLMAGPSAARPSYLSSPTGGDGINPAIAQGAGFSVVRRHEPILLDYVFAYNGYLADNTRIFSIGTPPDDLMSAHDAMLAVHRSVKKQLHPGVTAAELYELACQKATDLGYAENFMGTDDHRVLFIGHGIGLELDEYPILGKNQPMKLKTGMTLALEPKTVFPGKGVVGIENTHVVTETGAEQLTRFAEKICIV